MIIAQAQHKGSDLPTLFNWFIAYSYLGWLYETIYCFVDTGGFVNRGFLYGPFCPIYGSGIVFMILLFSRRCKSKLSLFFYCALFASALEYVVSFGMEYIFGRRWWNYSDRLLDVNGRICLEAAVVFGVSGVFVIRYLHPKLLHYADRNFSSKTLNNAAKIMFAVLLLDVLASIQISFIS